MIKWTWTEKLTKDNELTIRIINQRFNTYTENFLLHDHSEHARGIFRMFWLFYKENSIRANNCN